MFGRDTQCVDCRESMGLGRGGGLAQRGTLSETGRPDVIAIAMSPGRRHITKPVCEITYGLRREGIQVSVLVLNAGAGVPEDLTGKSAMGYGPKFGLTPVELEQIKRHKLLVLHLGNVDSHVISKTLAVLKFVDIPTVIACQNPIDFEQFAEAGIKTRLVKPRPENIQTEGTVMEIVSGITRGETCSRENLNKIVKYVKTINPLNN
ncbi:MAG: methyl-coenzyme M reductase I operon protein C [Methanosarcinales archaeon]|nr:methyl-coenzyme M reductase I operon protein C [ANME-2 cluster archaeon]MDF1530865.1 methyl-coenzyme M reductase I operon protein C [ANME-2 cluster archaeon]MDW7776171.1 methyl-coenzyme M reductase I operon protein C [Methanosarcinales archaeon]